MGVSPPTIQAISAQPARQRPSRWGTPIKSDRSTAKLKVGILQSRAIIGLGCSPSVLGLDGSQGATLPAHHRTRLACLHQGTNGDSSANSSGAAH